MSCCGSKRTVPPPPQTGVPTKNAPVASNVKASTLKSASKPVAKINFSATGFEGEPLTNQQSYIPTNKSINIINDEKERLEGYSSEMNTTEKSKMILSNNILEYKLDSEDGVSKTPVLNTFHYETTLNHHLTSQTRSRVSDISNQVSVYRKQIDSQKNIMKNEN